MGKYIGIILVGLLFIGCSDDDEPINPDSGMDMAVDTGGTDTVSDDTGINPDTSVADMTPDQAVDAGPPPWSASILVVEVDGTMGGNAAKMLMAEAMFDQPGVSTNPDYFAAGAIPQDYCIGYKWTDTTLPARSDGDAGKVTITGLTATQYVDGLNPGTPAALPSPLECVRGEVVAGSGVYGYSCGLPAVTALTGPALDDTTSLTIAVAGGADVDALSNSTGLAAGAKVVLKNTDLAALDFGSDIKVEWETTTATAMGIIMDAQNQDGTAFGRLICVGLAATGSRTISAAAFTALFPTPSDTNPLIVTSAVSTFMVDLGTTTAGNDYTLGVGRGVFGQTCRISSGLCPQP